MKIGRWTIRADQSADYSRANAVDIMQSQDRFRASVIRERRRVDRNQHRLSLLLFTIGGQNADDPAVRQFVQTLINRIRSTDEVGWFDSKRIGVILPYTRSGGAKKLAETICREATCKAVVVEYTIHTYPSDWFSNGNGHQDQSKVARLPPKSNMTISRNPCSDVTDSQEAGCVMETSSRSVRVPCDAGELSQGIDQCLLRPQPIWKRVTDICGGSLGLILLSPLFLLVAIIIRFFYGSPVIYKQQRVGYSRRLFTMWKFRTMENGEGKDIHQQYMSSLIDGAHDETSAKAMTKLDDDLPITGFGKFLRATCIDELPQLVNVLRGDMSLIGPRPPTVYEVENYSDWHYERFGSMPGMTGLWQVSGKNKLTFLEMIRLDIDYVRKMSLWLDVRILLKTPLVIAYEIKDSLNLHRHRLSLEEI